MRNQSPDSHRLETSYSTQYDCDGYSDVTRMDEVGLRIPKQALQWEVRSFRIQEKTWKSKDKLERYSEQGPSKKGINGTWEEVEASAQDRQTWRQRVALC